MTPVDLTRPPTNLDEVGRAAWLKLSHERERWRERVVDGSLSRMGDEEYTYARQPLLRAEEEYQLITGDPPPPAI